MFFQEFKKFAVKGNAIDLAIGVIMGGAFGKIVTSIVNDIIMPVLGTIIGGINLTNLKFVIREATESTPALTVNYGNFLQSIIDFTIIAFSIFLFVKFLNKIRKVEEVPKAPEKPTKEQLLLTEIRDILSKK